MIDPVAGSGSTLIAAMDLGRKAYGFEIDKTFYRKASEWINEYKKQGKLFTVKHYKQITFF